jgi:hypothetical protein
MKLTLVKIGVDSPRLHASFVADKGICELLGEKVTEKQPTFRFKRLLGTVMVWAGNSGKVSL